MRKILTLILKHFTSVNIIVGLSVLILVGLIKYSGIVLVLLDFIELDNTEYAEYIITGSLALAARLGLRGLVEEGSFSNSNHMTMDGVEGTSSSAGGGSASSDTTSGTRNPLRYRRVRGGRGTTSIPGDNSGTTSTAGGSSDTTNTVDSTSMPKQRFIKKFVVNSDFREENIKLLKSKELDNLDRQKLEHIEGGVLRIAREVKSIEEIKNNAEMSPKEVTEKIKSNRWLIKYCQLQIKNDIKHLVEKYPDLIPSEQELDITNQLSNLSMRKRSLSLSERTESDEVSRRVKPKK